MLTTNLFFKFTIVATAWNYLFMAADCLSNSCLQTCSFLDHYEESIVTSTEILFRYIHESWNMKEFAMALDSMGFYFCDVYLQKMRGAFSDQLLFQPQKIIFK